MSRNAPMSMESMLDEERKDVLALLEGNPPASQFNNPNNSSSTKDRSPSPYTSAPRSPVRSMLDIGDDNASVSGGGDGGKKTSPRNSNLPVRSMLDVDMPTTTRVASGPNSPVQSRSSMQLADGGHHARSVSDTSSKPSFGPRAPGGRLDPMAGFQFSDITTNYMGQAMPKRNTQGGKRASGGGGVMADLMRGNDLSSLALTGDKSSRHSSFSGPSGGRSSSRDNSTKSRSPLGRTGWRSSSPNGPGRVQQTSGNAVLDDGRVVNISNAYRKLSDANLALGGGSLSELASRKLDNASEEPGSGRLAKDYYLSPDGEDLGDSSDDGQDDSSDEEASRGRRRSPRSSEDKRRGSQTSGSAGSPNQERRTLSLLAAAEEERLQVSSQQKAQPQPGYRSLFDEPSITVTGPSGEKAKHSKPGVHPSTAFDQSPSSGPTSTNNSDEEHDISDIKRAQKLAFSSTPVISTPEASRSIRIIYRGEYADLRQAAEEEKRTLRRYLVATDLSDESGHALEWTIGTVLRDGDMLMAIYCADEETGIYSSDEVMVPDEAKAHKEAAAISSVTSEKDTPTTGTTATASAAAAAAAAVTPSVVSGTMSPMLTHFSSRASALGFGSRSSSPAPGASSNSNSNGNGNMNSNNNSERAEEERGRAIEEITERVTKMLRKTKLQVRVVVEVVHCKNPKHLITEVIDLVSPTLVILGSRGRSALKGVILGSFSNYLVTKSSVPVMVARKRLRKQSKYKRGPMRQVNNLSKPAGSSLANAKID